MPSKLARLTAIVTYQCCLAYFMNWSSWIIWLYSIYLICSCHWSLWQWILHNLFGHIRCSWVILVMLIMKPLIDMLSLLINATITITYRIRCDAMFAHLAFYYYMAFICYASFVGHYEHGYYISCLLICIVHWSAWSCLWYSFWSICHLYWPYRL